MRVSCRIFLLDQNDGLYRLPYTQYDQMLHEPNRCRLQRFAGSRVRMAEAIVELVDRRPIRVVRTTFDFLPFDGEGYVELNAFGLVQRARIETALAPALAMRESAGPIIDAGNRFVVRGATWAPSNTLARRIDEAALGRAKCPRL